VDIFEADGATTVKFESEQLPEILNALETDNGGNKLILEVSVRANTTTYLGRCHILIQQFSNIWVKALCDVLLWTVRRYP
jgi:hypothetical protein